MKRMRAREFDSRVEQVLDVESERWNVTVDFGNVEVDYERD